MRTLGNKAGWALAMVLGLLFVASASRMAFGDGGALEPPGPPAPGMKSLQEVEPRIPISSVPYTVTTSGSYYLTGNLTIGAPGTGITVNANHVTIDLNGFTLTGSGASGTGIDATSFPGYGVTVKNGTITNWGLGINAAGRDQGLYEDLLFSGNVNGLTIYNNTIVRNVDASINSGFGIRIVGSYNLLTDSEISQNAVQGLLVDGIRNEVSRNAVTANGTGIQATSLSPNFIVQNTLSGNTTNLNVSGAQFAPLETAPSVTNPWSNVAY